MFILSWWLIINVLSIQRVTYFDSSLTPRHGTLVLRGGRVHHGLSIRFSSYQNPEIQHATTSMMKSLTSFILALSVCNRFVFSYTSDKRSFTLDKPPSTPIFQAHQDQFHPNHTSVHSLKLHSILFSNGCCTVERGLEGHTLVIDNKIITNEQCTKIEASMLTLNSSSWLWLIILAQILVH